MAVKGERYMRVIVFFDLPTVTKKDKKIAAEFRKFLLQDGYYMLQWSVYSRVCKGMAEVETHSNRLRAVLPDTGSIRLLTVTEKQYASMEILVGTVKKGEKTGAIQLLLL
jgi:CRISPR-associated endoribonuclease Cas2